MRIEIDPDGFVVFSGQRLRCALGKNGIRSDKREGDEATPAGEYLLGRAFYRPDKLTHPPKTHIPVYALTPTMGWCDDTVHPDYNRLITLPHPAHHEKMWRDDDLYDIVIEILYNSDPVVPGKGSAIFMHVAKPNYAGTEGCIALKMKDILTLLQKCNNKTRLCIPGG